MAGAPGRKPRFPQEVRCSTEQPPQETPMADVTFVATTIAVFAPVAFIAKGVAKL
ncbi:hypothetical protein QWM81_09835 [Streptomyces ficellus]|uniref:Uncharacterized protein n=1 Tax=Streptomyces ficellus TaxID=1977088 RepID=A0ABT7Z4B7_9ACTN|nr:hypothetical protein [Streptomyces ficellus]MDN3294344.1 hypothetical protein [Streptomyces ficellus]